MSPKEDSHVNKYKTLTYPKSCISVIDFVVQEKMEMLVIIYKTSLPLVYILILLVINFVYHIVGIHVHN